MNRTDRLLAIVLELQAKKQVRAEDLAAKFEVSKRTIYRDMLALDEFGVPIVALPGQGYSLVEGYFLPPLTFNTDEAIMLLLGADFVGRNFDAQYREAAQSANQKIVTVLPEGLRQEVEYLEHSIRFIAINGQAASETLQQLRRAIIQRRTVRFRYHARYRDGQTERKQRPRGRPVCAHPRRQHLDDDRLLSSATGQAELPAGSDGGHDRPQSSLHSPGEFQNSTEQPG